ncbi:unnamed protein product [Vitrella brassicaformis CCMP3155]|uniref:Uncharacterized protein n=1 Tax=Vitrella brassicaformis (strain CCMP3155) TaxID=1169540 RepID=A0A0G4EMS2_VITBC|nr:unnamed protein product [Vitrella brassicaformis CCMP3155]|eukprot:CEL99127.1 unnamed protein product [Vitrella brassicaformis CCMP3155]
MSAAASESSPVFKSSHKMFDVGSLPGDALWALADQMTVGELVRVRRLNKAVRAGLGLTYMLQRLEHFNATHSARNLVIFKPEMPGTIRSAEEGWYEDRPAGPQPNPLGPFPVAEDPKFSTKRKVRRVLATLWVGEEGGDWEAWRPVMTRAAADPQDGVSLPVVVVVKAGEGRGKWHPSTSAKAYKSHPATFAQLTYLHHHLNCTFLMPRAGTTSRVYRLELRNNRRATWKVRCAQRGDTSNNPRIVARRCVGTSVTEFARPFLSFFEYEYFTPTPLPAVGLLGLPGQQQLNPNPNPNPAPAPAPPPPPPPPQDTHDTHDTHDNQDDDLAAHISDEPQPGGDTEEQEGPVGDREGGEQEGVGPDEGGDSELGVCVEDKGVDGGECADDEGGEGEQYSVEGEEHDGVDGEADEGGGGLDDDGNDIDMNSEHEQDEDGGLPQFSDWDSLVSSWGEDSIISGDTQCEYEATFVDRRRFADEDSSDEGEGGDQRREERDEAEERNCREMNQHIGRIVQRRRDEREMSEFLTFIAGMRRQRTHRDDEMDDDMDDEMNEMAAPSAAAAAGGPTAADNNSNSNPDNTDDMQ